MRLGKDFEPITIKIHREHRAALQRMFLEHPRANRYNGPKSYADLVREAIAKYVATPAEPAQPMIASSNGSAAKARALAAAELGLAVHFARKGSDDTSICGLADLRPQYLTTARTLATCNRCNEIIAANGRAIDASKLAPTPKPRQTTIAGTEAPKRSKAAPAKRSKAATSKKGARR